MFWDLEQRQPMVGLGGRPWLPRQVPLVPSVIPCKTQLPHQVFSQSIEVLFLGDVGNYLPCSGLGSD